MASNVSIWVYQIPSQVWTLLKLKQKMQWLNIRLRP